MSDTHGQYAMPSLTVPSKLGKREVAALMNGDKVNVFNGHHLLFAVPAKLVKHFSPKWKHQLDEEHAKVLHSSAHKEAIKLVIEWMAAGGAQSSVRGCIPYPKLDLVNLICLNKLAGELEIGALEEHTLIDIDVITRYRPVSLSQIGRVFSVSNVPSATTNMLEVNLKKRIGTPVDEAWIKESSRAGVHAFTKIATLILEKLRKEVKESRAARRRANQKPKLSNQARSMRKNMPFEYRKMTTKKMAGEPEIKTLAAHTEHVEDKQIDMAKVSELIVVTKGTKISEQGRSVRENVDNVVIEKSCGDNKLKIPASRTDNVQEKQTGIKDASELVPLIKDTKGPKTSSKPFEKKERFGRSTGGRVRIANEDTLCFICGHYGHYKAQCPETLVAHLQEKKTQTSNASELVGATTGTYESRLTSKPLEKSKNSGPSRGQRGKSANKATLCFNCGQPGHLKVDCSNPRVVVGKCRICGGRGHRAAECVTKPVKSVQALRADGPVRAETTPGAKRKNTGGVITVAEDKVSLPKPRTVTPKDGEVVSMKDIGNSTANLQEVPNKAQRFITKRVRALKISKDGSAEREMVPGLEAATQSPGGSDKEN